MAKRKRRLRLDELEDRALMAFRRRDRDGATALTARTNDSGLAKFIDVVKNGAAVGIYKVTGNRLRYFKPPPRWYW